MTTILTQGEGQRVEMEPLVSICCITYNHEKYIADALDSFLMQETSFAFEIIVHDDASTDKTPEIIAKYEREYPDIVKPIYQKENKYSKGIKIIPEYVVPKIKGKYAATCEGDDYWIDKRKLQKQIDFMEKNQTYNMCFHSAKIVDTNKKFTGRYFGPFGCGSRKISIRETARGGILHASTRLVRSELYTKKRPDWMKNAKHGDYALALYFTAEGDVYYIDDAMSAYRTGVENSLMTNHRKNYSKEKEIKYHLNRIDTLNMADEYYNYKFNSEIQSVNLDSEVIIAILRNDYNITSRKKINLYIKNRGIISFLKLVIVQMFPNLSKKLSSIRGLFISRSYRKKVKVNE